VGLVLCDFAVEGVYLIGIVGGKRHGDVGAGGAGGAGDEGRDGEGSFEQGYVPCAVLRVVRRRW
jgi:hypothetical protein